MNLSDPKPTRGQMVRRRCLWEFRMCLIEHGCNKNTCHIAALEAERDQAPFRFVVNAFEDELARNGGLTLAEAGELSFQIINASEARFA